MSKSEALRHPTPDSVITGNFSEDLAEGQILDISLKNTCWAVTNPTAGTGELIEPGKYNVQIVGDTYMLIEVSDETVRKDLKTYYLRIEK